MDTLDSYRQITEKILSEYAAVPYAYGEIQTEVVFDRKNDRYLLVNVGWDGECLRHAALTPSSRLYYSLQYKLDDAMSAFRTILKLDDNNELMDSIAYNFMGNILEMQGKTDAAISEYKEAIRLNFFNELAHKQLGNILISQGISSGQVSKINEGIIELKQASELYRASDEAESADKIDKIVNSLKN